MFTDRELGAQAVSAAFHSSVIVALHPPSLPVASLYHRPHPSRSQQMLCLRIS
jgi:hypothetical protein